MDTEKDNFEKSLLTAIKKISFGNIELQFKDQTVKATHVQYRKECWLAFESLFNDTDFVPCVPWRNFAIDVYQGVFGMVKLEYFSYVQVDSLNKKKNWCITSEYLPVTFRKNPTQWSFYGEKNPFGLRVVERTLIFRCKSQTISQWCIYQCVTKTGDKGSPWWYESKKQILDFELL